MQPRPVAAPLVRAVAWATAAVGFAAIGAVALAVTLRRDGLANALAYVGVTCLTVTIGLRVWAMTLVPMPLALPRKQSP